MSLPQFDEGEHIDAPRRIRFAHEHEIASHADTGCTRHFTDLRGWPRQVGRLRGWNPRRTPNREGRPSRHLLSRGRVERRADRAVVAWFPDQLADVPQPDPAAGRSL